MKKNIALMLVALMLVNFAFLPSMAQANELRQPEAPLILDPSIMSFLDTQDLRPSHFDEEGNLFAFTENGQLAMITARALNHIQYPIHDHGGEANRSICGAITTILIWVATHPVETMMIIDICMNIYDLVQEYGIWSATGTHNPGQPYMPFYPAPHFDVSSGLVNWY